MAKGYQVWKPCYNLSGADVVFKVDYLWNGCVKKDEVNANLVLCNWPNFRPPINYAFSPRLSLFFTFSAAKMLHLAEPPRHTCRCLQFCSAPFEYKLRIRSFTLIVFAQTSTYRSFPLHPSRKITCLPRKNSFPVKAK